MAGITSVSTVEYRQYYLSNTGASTNSAVSTTTATNDNRQRADKESANLSKAAEELKNSLKAFSQDGMLADLFEDGTTSNSFQIMVRDSLEKLVKSYNKFNEVIKSSKYITSEGAKLLDQVQELLIGKNSADYRKMGLDLNKQTGQIRFDDKRFMAFINEDVAKTGKMLINDKYLATALQNVQQLVLGRQAGYYFSKPVDISV